MKKLFLSILLLCCCIVFTGCGGNSNSYDNAYRITISKEIINKGDSGESSRAATSERRDVKLFLNGVEFPGHSFDSDGNYVFTKVMYNQEANEICSHDTSSFIELFEGSSELPFDTTEFESLVPLFQTIIAYIGDDGKIHMFGGNREISIYNHNGEEQEGLKKVEKVEIEKVDSLTAKVTFKNGKGECVDIGFYDSWTISGTDITDNTKSASYTYNENKKKTYFIVENFNKGVYNISLTSDGETKATLGNHTLNNTEITINEIKNGDKDVVDPSILKKAVYRPSTK